MTTPAPPPAAAPGPYPCQRGYWSLARLLLVVGTVLFVLAAFAAGGHPLAGITDWSWAFGGFAAWVLSGAVP
jgi:hypothetical protein